MRRPVCVGKADEVQRAGGSGAVIRPLRLRRWCQVWRAWPRALVRSDQALASPARACSAGSPVDGGDAGPGQVGQVGGRPGEPQAGDDPVGGEGPAHGVGPGAGLDPGGGPGVGQALGQLRGPDGEHREPPLGPEAVGRVGAGQVLGEVLGRRLRAGLEATTPTSQPPPVGR